MHEYEKQTARASKLKRPRLRAEAAAAAVAAFNADFPQGARVRYWTALREGEGKPGTVRAPAEVRYTIPVVWVHEYSSYINMTHVAPAQ